jgi:hypothetical protein
MINWKAFGRKLLWSYISIILALALRNWGTPEKTSIRIASVLAKTQTKHLLNTVPEHC